jgi:dimethylamine/trimethylamine dehydrogenase
VDELIGPTGLTSDAEGRDIIEMFAELPDLWGRQYQRLGER